MATHGRNLVSSLLLLRGNYVNANRGIFSIPLAIDLKYFLIAFPIVFLWGLPLIMYASRGRGGGSSLLYIYIAYHMQKGGQGVHVKMRT